MMDASAAPSEFKALAASAIDRAARMSGVLAWMRRRCKGGITILMYHRVLPIDFAPKYPFQNLVVDVPTFEQHMAWLATRFRMLTLREAAAALDGPHRDLLNGPLPVACVTFDDGYCDNADHAAPILEQHGLRRPFS